MQCESRNIYQRSREAAGYTQERAAELIGVSVESIRAYEGDRRIPPDTVAMSMVEVYGTQHLAYQHLKNSAEIARRYLPDISEKTDIPSMILRLHKEVNDFLPLRDALIEITYDGIISADELPRFNAIMKELDDIHAAILAIKFRENE